ncbi:hypothetical protein NFI96_006826 [Prochilodus magdalenae]|nr:hypothetical protein NFI96_006826 [Prochilodus magdalenae]
MFTLTPLRQRRIHKALTAPNISYTHEGVNMAEGMLEGPPHECEEQVERQGKVRRNRGGDREHEIPPEVAVAPWLYLRAIKRKWSEPRWTGPFRVTERTSHAVRLQGKGSSWYHLSQCKPALPPGEQQVQKQASN